MQIATEREIERVYDGGTKRGEEDEAVRRQDAQSAVCDDDRPKRRGMQSGGVRVDNS